MLGSLHDAEDVVQETYLRAWRSYDEFENRSSVRTWLHRIATNACLTELQHRRRRVLPSGLGGPSDDPHTEPAPTGPAVAWLQPIPDAVVDPATDDPAAVVASRESLRLALVASLQHLPAQQRAVLLLRDVLAFPAAEVAAMLGTTVAAVKSTLQRARATMKDAAPAPDEITEPREPRARELLAQYIAAFESRHRNPGTGAATRRRTGDGRIAHVVRRPHDLPPIPRNVCPWIPRRLADAGDHRQRPARGGRLPPQRRRRTAGLRDRGADRHPDGHRGSSCSATQSSPRPSAYRTPSRVNKDHVERNCGQNIVPAPVELAIDKYSGAAGKSLERRAKPDPAACISARAVSQTQLVARQLTTMA
jgi:RNA polymerase sigma factor (sigma-70 family)